MSTTKVTWDLLIDWSPLDEQCRLIGKLIDERIPKAQYDKVVNDELGTLTGIHELLSDLWEQRPQGEHDGFQDD